VVFKTHLDVGFSDLAATVVARYMDEHIPNAITLAEQLRRRREEAAPGTDEAGDGFIWTTGSWLIYEYLEHADAAGRRRMEEAIARGEVAWHALPFSFFTESMDAPLFRHGLGLSQKLDRRFGKHTIAAKMTDVPGHTRGIVPLLAEAGVRFLHIGVNAACTSPDVPPLFVWRDPESQTDIAVMYQGNYGDVMVVPDLRDALAFAHTDDNVGPQSIDQVVDTFRDLRTRFPGADVRASTMDAFAAHLPEVGDGLPVVTAEVGDTWIYGVGSDPRKEAQFRALLRLRRDLEGSGASADDLDGFSDQLLLLPEHTHGLDVKTHLKDWTNYGAADFRAARGAPNFRKMEASWQEQRDYIHAAVDALPPRLQAEANTRLAALTPVLPDVSEYEPVGDLSQSLEAGPFTVAFDPELGCLTRLSLDGAEWAEPANPLGRYSYETYSAADYDRFAARYLIRKRVTSWYAIPDFTKPGIEATAEHRVFLPRVTWAGRRTRDDGESFLVLLEMPAESYERFGAPRQLSLEIGFSHAAPEVTFELQWFGKSASRLPEASWFSFVLPARSPRWLKSWRMDKLGEWVSPYDVIRNGNRHLHAVGSGLRAEDDGHTVTLDTLDAPLVAPGKPAMLDHSNRQPELRDGIHFNLHNNLWGTDFPQWYEDDARFRFTLRIDAREPVDGGGSHARTPAGTPVRVL
jgi:hypothetical protein